MDRLSTAARSKNMAAIRSERNATTEQRLRAHLVRNGISGWCLHAVSVPGKPDFFFRKQKLAIFVDGCFWHGCPKCGHTPHSNTSYWTTKLSRNQARDKTITGALRRSGIRVLRVWEHELRLHPEKVIRRVAALIHDQD